MNEWVKCSERMPDKIEPFLAKTIYGIEMMVWTENRDYPEKDGWYKLYSACACCNGYCSAQFDYWMPLPPKPEGE